MYEVETKHYQGPLDKLLELVKKEELEITLINLAEVTENFFNYLRELKENEAPERIIADFLDIASKLILIKSKVLIPEFNLEEEEEEKAENLELQLEIYQKVKELEEKIKENWSQNPKMETRDFLTNKETFFYPPAKLGHNDLKRKITEIDKELEKLKPVETVDHEPLNLKDKITEVLSRLKERSIKIKSTSQKTKQEVVSLFMAVLHLFKDEKIKMKQTEKYGEIHVETREEKNNN
ncbi:MAG: ScpA family protein [Candidatus Magasanikbacteria bacterium]